MRCRVANGTGATPSGARAETEGSPPRPKGPCKANRRGAARVSVASTEAR
jgi:hypothetical protein